MYCLNILIKFLDAKSIYKIFEVRLQARDEQIKALKSDPSISDKYSKLIYEMQISKPLIFSTKKGLFASQLLTIYSLISTSSQPSSSIL